VSEYKSGDALCTWVVGEAFDRRRSIEAVVESFLGDEVAQKVSKEEVLRAASDLLIEAQGCEFVHCAPSHVYGEEVVADYLMCELVDAHTPFCATPVFEAGMECGEVDFAFVKEADEEFGVDFFLAEPYVQESAHDGVVADVEAREGALRTPFDLRGVGELEDLIGGELPILGSAPVVSVDVERRFHAIDEVVRGDRAEVMRHVESSTLRSSPDAERRPMLGAVR
jgi:hypothetical protein